MQKQITFVLLLVAGASHAQITDSVYHQLQEIEIKPVSAQTQLRSLSSEGSITKDELAKQSSYSLLPAINNIPGVRMEERSPGSYRLSIRGSLIRSPFGVRNVKIYLADLPFTDAGGNTYLNSLDIGNLNGLKILKGPEASIFGANTGGVLQIDPIYKSPDSLKIVASLNTGSYGSFHENFLIQKRSKHSLFSLNQGYQRSNGYRKNTMMERHYAQLSEILSYSSKAQLRILVLFSDMKYQTPGGLTLQQFDADPRQARPASATLPGAEQQKAAVYNTTIFGGATHDIYITKNIRHVLSVFGSHTDFKNPFITNFEQRTEATFGVRTYFDGTISKPEDISAKWDFGGEWQQTNSNISNFGNRLGQKDTVQAADQLKAQQSFLFARFLVDLKQNILIETSCSYNFFSYRYKNIFPFAETSFKKNNFNPQLMPRIATSLKIMANVSVRVSMSAGYSSPTLAEIRPSDNIVNKNLQAETGISYETGIRVRDNRDYILFDACVFYYQLKNAIVRRLNDDGTEYFINAGGTKQPGLEAQLNVWIIKPRVTGFLRSLQIKGNLTCYQFRFERYRAVNADYSGNKLTGVPDYTSAESIYFVFPANLSLYIQYYYSSAIPLNDANTVKANDYHLVQLKGEWKRSFKKLTFSIFAGIDNVLNQSYSLGNDLNAVGGRYYNAAPPRNYYGGIKLEF